MILYYDYYMRIARAKIIYENIYILFLKNYPHKLKIFSFFIKNLRASKMVFTTVSVNLFEMVHSKWFVKKMEFP